MSCVKKLVWYCLFYFIYCLFFCCFDCFVDNVKNELVVEVLEKGIRVLGGVCCISFGDDCCWYGFMKLIVNDDNC